MRGGRNSTSTFKTMAYRLRWVFLSAMAMPLIVVVTIMPMFGGEGPATVQSDKTDYAPGNVVKISGTGWQPGESVVLTLQETPYLDTHGPFTAIASDAGAILDQSFIPDAHDLGVTFTLTAYGVISHRSAQATFRDGLGLNLDQCANAPGSGANPPIRGVACGTTPTNSNPNWQNGDLNRSNSAYLEGDGVPYRLAITGLSIGTWTIRLEYDYTKGGKHAIDRLTRYTLSQAAAPCL